MAASGIVTGRASAGRRNATLPTGPGRAGSTSGRRGALRREEEETEHADHRADREHPGEPPEGHARRSIPSSRRRTERMTAITPRTATNRSANIQ